MRHNDHQGATLSHFEQILQSHWVSKESVTLHCEYGDVEGVRVPEKPIIPCKARGVAAPSAAELTDILKKLEGAFNSFVLLFVSVCPF